MQNFQRENKETMAPAGTYKIGPQKKFLGRAQEEKGIQSSMEEREESMSSLRNQPNSRQVVLIQR